ncbi:Uncharacterised protein [Brucella intermedia]|nr:Uncharacterised protein [Brucella intermedia]
MKKPPVARRLFNFHELERFRLKRSRWNCSNYLFCRIFLTQNRFALLLEMLYAVSGSNPEADELPASLP